MLGADGSHPRIERRLSFPEIGHQQGQTSGCSFSPSGAQVFSTTHILSEAATGVSVQPCCGS
jgi:hypothetical protein